MARSRHEAIACTGEYHSRAGLRATGHKRGRDFREPQKIAIICLKFGVHPGNIGWRLS